MMSGVFLYEFIVIKLLLLIIIVLMIELRLFLSLIISFFVLRDVNLRYE